MIKLKCIDASSANFLEEGKIYETNRPKFSIGPFSYYELDLSGDRSFYLSAERFVKVGGSEDIKSNIEVEW